MGTLGTRASKFFCSGTQGTKGVTTIHTSTGCAIFWGAFFKQKINFRVSIFVKSKIDINFGMSSSKNNSLGIYFDHISHTWLKFSIVIKNFRVYILQNIRV